MNEDSIDAFPLPTKRQAVGQLPSIRSFATYQGERGHLASHQSYLALHLNKCER